MLNLKLYILFTTCTIVFAYEAILENMRKLKEKQLESAQKGTLMRDMTIKSWDDREHIRRSKGNFPQKDSNAEFEKQDMKRVVELTLKNAEECEKEEMESAGERQGRIDLLVESLFEPQISDAINLLVGSLAPKGGHDGHSRSHRLPPTLTNESVENETSNAAVDRWLETRPKTIEPPTRV